MVTWAVIHPSGDLLIYNYVLYINQINHSLYKPSLVIALPNILLSGAGFLNAVKLLVMRGLLPCLMKIGSCALTVAVEEY
jgi:hypothetical protein